MRAEIDDASASAETALAAFVSDEGARLIQFAFLLTRDQYEAQDLAQTVLYRLARRGVATLDDPVSFARRCLINEHRSNLRRFKARVNALARINANNPVVPDHAIDVAATITTAAALGALTPRQREAVVLRYYGDLTDEQIADALSCAPGTVRSLLSRAMPALRSALTQTETRDR